MAAQRTNTYEAMFLFGPSGSTEPQAALDMARSAVERHGGQIIVIKKWDERKLMFEIAGQKRGTYILCYFRAPSIAPAQIERDVRLSDVMLRVLILKAEHLNEQEMAAMEPQPIAPPREDRPIDYNAMGDSRPPRRRREDEIPADAAKD
jgi:small subunit ribosomal protein S6